MTTASNVEGIWQFVAKTPRGPQQCTLSVVPDGDRFTGTVNGDFGELEVTDGQIEDGPVTVLRWAMKLKNPLPITVKAHVELTGDELTGKLTAFGLGSFPVAGGRPS